MNVFAVVIHFVGLCLFSNQIPNDPGLHVILPRVQSSTHMMNHMDHAAVAMRSEAARPGADRPAVPSRSAFNPRTLPDSLVVADPVMAGGGNGIEGHTSMLIFPSAIADDTQWKATKLVASTGPAALQAFSYVPLDGEQITFVADAPNPAASLPGKLPKFSCPGSPPLIPAFQWPYAGAAAVIDLPEGVLSACSPGAIAPGRVDTRLVLNTAGTLTVVALSKGKLKTLVLNTKNDPRIYIANIPLRWAQGNHADSTGEKHYIAYFEMIGKNKNSGCSGAPAGPPVPTCPISPQFIPPNPTGGDGRNSLRRVSATTLGGPAPAQGDPVLQLLVANSECSNTQWP